MPFSLLDLGMNDIKMCILPTLLLADYLVKL